MGAGRVERLVARGIADSRLVNVEPVLARGKATILGIDDSDRDTALSFLDRGNANRLTFNTGQRKLGPQWWSFLFFDRSHLRRGGSGILRERERASAQRQAGCQKPADESCSESSGHKHEPPLMRM